MVGEKEIGRYFRIVGGGVVLDEGDFVMVYISISWFLF